MSTLVAIFYGGMSFGITPMDRSISFEMHIAGVIAGVFCAFIYGKYTRFERLRKNEVSQM